MKHIENLKLQMIKKLMEHYIITTYNDVEAKVISINVEDIDFVEDNTEVISAEIRCNGVLGVITLEWDYEDEEFIGSHAEEDEEGVQYNFFGHKHQDFEIPPLPLSADSETIVEFLNDAFPKDIVLKVPVTSATVHYPSDKYQYINDGCFSTLFEYLLNVIPKIQKMFEEESDKIAKGHSIDEYVIERVCFIGNGHSFIRIVNAPC